MATLIKIDKNGSKHFEGFVKCDRCGGDGVYKWGAMISYGAGQPAIPQFAGTCFKCGGSGKVFCKWIERTAEYQAKLDAKREAKHAKAQAEREAKEAEEMARRLKEKAEREAAEAARKAISQYVGSVGDKLTVTVTLERQVNYEVPSFGGYGYTMMTIYIFKDEAGNKLVWRTSGILNKAKKGEAVTPVEDGETVTIKGTVKAHDAYKGERQTELQRVKVVC